MSTATVSSTPTYISNPKTQTSTGTSAVASNSILTEASANGNTGEEQTVASEIDKILQKICEKFKKYGITPEDLKKNPMIQKAEKLTLQQASQIPEKNREKALKACEECLEAAIKDSVVNGKIDIDKMNRLSNNYFVALSTGWTIEGFKRHNNAVKKSSLLDRLIETKCLPKGSTLENTSPETIKSAIKNFFESMTGKVKANPSPNEVKAQLQTFGRLLINSPEEEKELFLEVLKQLYSENKLKGLEAIFESCRNDTTRSDIARAAGDPDYMKELTSGDNPMSKEDSLVASKLTTQYSTEKDLIYNYNKYKEVRREWYTNNSEVLQSIKQKIEKAKQEGVKPEFTEEENQVILEHENFIISVSTGKFIGTADGNFSEEFKTSHLETLNKDAYELQDYKEILEEVNNYFKNHPETLTNSKEYIEKLIDKSTNGNYSIVASGSDAELIPPAAEKNESTATAVNEDTGVGFDKPKTQPDPEKVRDLYKKIYDNSNDETTYTIIAPAKTNESSVTNPINESGRVENLSTYLNLGKKELKKLISKAPYLMNDFATKLKSISDPITILNKFPSNKIRFELTKMLVKSGHLNKDGISELNLGTSEKNILNQMCEDFEKQTNKDQAEV